MRFKLLAAGAVLAAATFGATQASAVVISNGGYSVGIGVNGELYDAGADIGFLRDGYDPISPGTPRDSWGLNGAYADSQFYGSNGIISTDIVANGDTATATTLTTDGFQVVQTYSFLNNILKIDTTVTNLTGDVLTGVFQRNVDWDMPEGAENIFGPFGARNGVLDSSYYGFDNPDASAAYDFSCKRGCDEVGDLGAGIKISLGSIGAGKSRSFAYYYGLNLPGGGAGDLISEAQGAGAQYLIAASGDGSSSHHAVIGVSGAVPEPAGWAMMILGFFGLGFTFRRDRKPARA
ncbi:hypothetical protein [Phenylobacterium sp.]|uniref:hypothetical protein n=1 Tax=Phenylobacterium sp. TaxID=1871053 RepID=UPI0025CC6E69|nr:hypothetical protein [Phenylobacterium sp.]MBX3483280.1 hypothetical protein [Phenylobacterium sp.]MCW5758466.1 hypothetical protein [Phenylobacterium sp.]